MGWQAWFTLAVVSFAFVAMVRGIAQPGPAILTAVILLLGAGVIEPAQAFAGFSNPAPITVAALFVLARAVEETGVLRPLVRGALGPGRGYVGSLLRLCLPSAAASAFLNNTPIVAMLMHPVSEWAERGGRSPSRFLMPLSFAVILGGVVTTIGTSTNLLISGMLEQAGQPPLGLFEISRVGVPLALAGILLVCLAAPVLLRERQSPRSGLAAAERDFVVRMIVEPGGPIAGRNVEQAGLRHLEGVFLVELERDGEPMTPVRPTTVLHGGDHLLFVGQARLILDLRNRPGLISAEGPHLEELETDDHRFVEVVIGASSPLLGRTPKQAGFRERYQAAIVGIHREGQPVVAKLGEVRLRLGDVLLLLADPGFRSRWRDRSDFLVIAPLDGERELPIPIRRAILVGAVGLAVVGLAGSGLFPILHASLLAAALLIVSGAVSVQAARQSIEVDVLLVIAASFGLGAALETSGLAGVIARGLVDAGGGMGPGFVLLGVVLATVGLTEAISNNAAAALMFPIAVAAAQQSGEDPRAFAIAVAVSASCSFLTPIGYQTNTMVYGPGGYRFGDYLRLGLPLTVIAVVIVTTML
jgi:di/tricarboxylate transporter